LLIGAGGWSRSVNVRCAGCGRPCLGAHHMDPNTSWWGPILINEEPGPAGRLSIGRIVPSAAVMFTPGSSEDIEHGAEPVNCSTNVVVKYPPLVEVVRALCGSSRNSAPSHPSRFAGAGGASAGARSVTDRTPAGFHGSAAVEVGAGDAGVLVLAIAVEDGVRLADVADGDTEGGNGAEVAHPAADISSTTPTSTISFGCILLISRSV